MLGPLLLAPTVLTTEHVCVQGGSAVYRGGVAGQGSGEGPGLQNAQVFKVRITNHYAEEEVEVEVPEDRWGPGLPGCLTARFCSSLSCPAALSPSLPVACVTKRLRCAALRRYVLYAAEEQGFELPYACRLGCCTACTVKVKEGEMFQPHSLGLSKNLRDQVSRGQARACAQPRVTVCQRAGLARGGPASVQQR